MLHYIYKVLWHIIHFMYSLINRISYIWEIIKAKYVNVQENSVKDLEYIHKHTSKLKNIPIHISFLIGKEDPSCKDLAKLILWSIASGISFISFYDIEGKLKANEEDLQIQIEKHLINDYHIIWHKTSKNGYKNGYSGKKIHVKLFDPSDGRESIASAAKDLVKNRNITIEAIDEYLHKRFEFPDPQLAIYCGDYFNLKGYPPWQIRLTEFLNIDTHHNLHFLKFINVLRRYSKCEQRVGK